MPAFSSYGSSFSYSATTSPASYFPVANATNVSFSGIAATEIDVTALTSTGKTYVLGTSDPGTVEVTSFMDRTGAPLLPVSGDSTPGLFIAIFGDDQTTGSQYIRVSGSCYLQSVSFEAAVDAAVSATYTYRLTGAVTVQALTAP